MEEVVKQTTYATWDDGDFPEGTSDPSISIAEDVPTLTVAAILGVTIVVLIAIAAVFVLGILIDYRQQGLLNKKLGEIRRMKNHKRVSAHPGAQSAGDVLRIAYNMEEPELTLPPGNSIQQIP